jgi:hypothetical protein
MKNRLLSNYLTTGLAILIIIYCMFMLNKEGTNWQDLTGFFGMAGLLLRSKDSLIGIDREAKK